MIKIDKELKDIMPPLNEDEYILLEESIKEEGIREPLILWKEKNILIDGHNRMEIAEKHNLNFEIIEKSFNNRKDVKNYIYEIALSRRNLDKRYYDLFLGKLYNEQKKQGKRTDLTSGQNVQKSKELAEKFGKNEKTIRRKGKLVENIDSLGEDVKDLYLQGNLRETDINELIKSVNDKNIDDNDKKDIIKEIKSGKDYKKAKKEIKNKKKHKVLKEKINQFKSTTDTFKLYNKDIQDLDIEKNSVDVILTDPPYPYEFIDTFEWLAEFASKTLKENGICVVMSGQNHLPEVMKRLEKHLYYHWLAFYSTPGQSYYSHNRQISSNCKPLLIYTKTKNVKLERSLYDTIISPKREKNDHEWQQSYSGMEDAIKKLTNPNDLVCDPYMGSGTTGLAAIKNNRRFIGNDIDEKAYNIALEKLNKNSDNNA